MPEPDDLKEIRIGLTPDKTAAKVVFMREDNKYLSATLTPDTLSQLIAKLQSLYKKLVH